MSQERLYAVFLLLLGACAFFFGLGWRDFWAPVEPRYAEIARVMYANNEWLVPTVNGSLYTDKPILYFWLVLVFSHIAGEVNEWTVRLPAALGAFGMVLTTYKLGRDFFTARIGFIAAAVLASSVRVMWEGRWAHVDTLFACFFTLSMYFGARAILQRGPANEMVAAYGFTALATLTKGLIGVVLPGLILLAFMIARRDWRMVRDARPLQGIAVFLLLAGPWFFLVNQLTGGAWLHDFIYIHHIQRYTAGLGHHQPFYYYLTTLPADFLPWTIFALAALCTHRPSKKTITEPVPLFFLLWFLVVLFFFTLSNTKRDLYLLPLFPVMALFVGSYLDGLISGDAPDGAFYRGMTLVFFNLLWLVSFALPIATWTLRREAFSISLLPAFVLGGGALATVHFILRRSVWRVFGSTCLTMVLGVIVATLSVLPYVNQFKSPRGLAQAITDILPTGALLKIYADSMNDFNFYMKREVIPVILSTAELQKFIDQDQTSYLMIKEKDMKRTGVVPEDRALFKKGIPGRYWYLIGPGGP